MRSSRYYVLIVTTIWHFFFLQTIAILQGSLNSTLAITGYGLSSPYLIDIPPPPNCDQASSSDKLTSSPVSLWHVDTRHLINQGLIYWSETYVTKCYRGFFGNIDQSVNSVFLTEPPNIDHNDLVKFYQDLEYPEVISLTSDSVYECKWLSTVIKKTTKTWIKKTKIYYNYHGIFVADDKEWRLRLTDEKWQSGFYRLYIIKPDDEDECPPMIKTTYPGIVQNNEQYQFITIPSLELQFNVIFQKQFVFCNIKNQTIFRTPEQYLISTGWKLNGKRMKDELGWNTDYSWAHTLYDINLLEDLIVKDLQTLEKEICTLRRLSWRSSIDSRDYNKIAQYHTGNIWAVGNKVGTKLSIQTPVIVHRNCLLPKSRKFNETHVLVICPGVGEQFIAPWTNFLSSIECNSKTEYGYWIKGSDNTYINYITGVIITNFKLTKFSYYKFKEINLNQLFLNFENHPIQTGSVINNELISTTNYTSDLFTEVGSKISNLFATIEAKITLGLLLIGTLIIIFILCWFK